MTSLAGFEFTAVDEAIAPVAAAPGLARRVLRRPSAAISIAFLAALVAVAIVAPIAMPGIAHQQTGPNLLANQQTPSSGHLLGTDTLGRDVLDRLLVGTGVTMAGVGEALLTVLALGVPLGIIAGYFGGWADRVVTWLADLTFSMPTIIIVIVVLTVLGQSMLVGMVTFGVLSAPGLMRVVRSATLPVREELYIDAARVSGLSRRRIIVRHILPRISGPLIVQGSLLAAAALLAQTALAFLGLVVPAPAPSWGGMFQNGLSVIELQPWLIWPPGIAIVLTVLAFGLLGDAVRDASTETWQSTPGRRRAGRRRRSATTGCSRARVDTTSTALLSVRDVSVSLGLPSGRAIVVDDVSFDIEAGEIVAIVGESGCGKTMTAMAIIGLLPSSGALDAGSVVFRGDDLTRVTARELQRVRGSEIAYISQEPMIGLNPAFRVGAQIIEAVRLHTHVSRSAARVRMLELLRDVQLPDPEGVARRYPHELSGGMAQRVVIARALAGSPKLLIADEPTTALDVTVQAEILDLLRQLQARHGMAILLITHDWGVVADLCTRALVMYAGQIVESGELGPLMHSPIQPYTEALLASDPHRAVPGNELPTISGTVPSPGAWPAGCRFEPRCAYRTDECMTGEIALVAPIPDRATRCIHFEQLPGWEKS